MYEIFRNARLSIAGMWRFRALGLGVAWAVGALALAGLMLLPSRYEASARIFVNTDSILKPLMTGLTVQPNEEQRILMLSRVVISRPNVESIVAKVGLDEEASAPEQRERIIERVMKTLEFRAGGRDNIFTLSYRDEDPARARRVIELLAALFIESSRGGKSEDTETAKRFIDEQIAVYERKLQDAEGRLKEFRLRYLGLTPGDGRDYYQRMSETSRQLDQARLELREAERSRDAYRRGLASEDTAVSATPSANLALGEMDTRLAEMRRNLDTLLQRYTDQHPDVVGLRRVIRELEQQRRTVAATARPSTGGSASSADPVATLGAGGPRAAEALKVSLAQAEASVAALGIRVAEFSERYQKLKASAALLPQLDAEYAQLNRDYDVNKKNYESLVSRRESATISGDMQSVAGVSDYRIVDPPRVSPTPVSPNRRLLLPLALLLAVAAGVGAMYVAHEVRPAIHDAQSLREVTELPVLGVVSALETDRSRRDYRGSLVRLGTGVAALVGTYAAAFIAAELILVRHV